MQPTATLTSRQRVLTALAGGVPDRVPWIEISVGTDIQRRIMSGRADFTPGEFCATLGLDSVGVFGPANTDLRPETRQQRYLYPEHPEFRFEPPYIAELGMETVTGRIYPHRPLLKGPADLKLLDSYLPDPDHPVRYERVQQWVARYKGDHADFAIIRMGPQTGVLSMGLDTAALSMYDDPSFLHAVQARLAEWCARVAEHVNHLDVDFVVAMDDLADSHGPWFSPAAFREFFLPYMREVARRIKKPWIFHSDGNITPLLPDLLTLGMNGIHPIQPDVMDIGAIKRQWGDRVCLVGNIDLVYIMTRATPAEVDANVRATIAAAAPGGRYILCCSPNITPYCKFENVLALARAVARYGTYPHLANAPGGLQDRTETGEAEC